MADFTYRQPEEMSAEDLRRFMGTPEYGNLSPSARRYFEQLLQSQGSSAGISGEFPNVPSLPSAASPPERPSFSPSESMAIQRGLAPRVPPASMEDMLSSVMGPPGERPTPAPVPAPAPPAPVRTPTPPARPSAPAAGAAPAARPSQPGIEDVISQRLGALKPPESAQSFMDSPYLALVQAGLSMIADSRGKSPLEAIAGGGRAGLQTLAQQRADQRAREEKNYERQLNRLKIESDLRDSMGRLQHYQDTTRLKEMELEEARRRGASAMEIQRRELEINERRAVQQERANDLTEQRLTQTTRTADDRMLMDLYRESANIVQRLGSDPSNPDVPIARQTMNRVLQELQRRGLSLPQGTQGGSVESAAGMARRPG